MTSIPERADVVVVGLGAMGSMTAWQAAARGATVVGIEQFSTAHARGSSHGGSRIFRTILFEGADYVPMARASLELFRRLEQESGTTLLTVSGGVTIGPAEGELIKEARTSAEEQGVDHEVLDADQIRARFPQHNVFDDDVAVYEGGAGALRPERAVQAAVDAARRCGATIITDTGVTAVHPGDGEVVVVTERGSIRARKVVLATGAWFNDLVPWLSLPLEIQRSCLAWYTGTPSADFTPERFPVFIRESDGVDGWGIPDIDGQGVKVGAGPSTFKPYLDRPEDNWVAPGPADLRPIDEFVRKAFHGLSSRSVDAAACMNSKTPDWDFVIGTAAAAPDLVLLGGFSGHGFKHAAGVGRIAAELALDGGTDIPIARFSPDRFTEAAR